MKPWIWVGMVVVTVAIGATGCTFTRAGYKSAAHTVVRTDGKFEVRDYAPLRLAETSMSGDENGGFSRLFNFISGKNASSQKIAMTTPVFMERPVGSQSGSMAFVLPEDLQQPPTPSQTNIWLREVPGGRFAVHRFAAPRPDPKREAIAASELRVWMEQEKLGPTGEPIFAYFDPPWIPRWFRRNEVMLRVISPTPAL
jgi:hypothetical protein